MRTPLEREQVLSAIEALARSLHLTTDLQIISERGNLIACPAGSGLIIRAQYLNAFIYRKPEEWLAREFRVAHALHQVAAPVAIPYAGPEPVLHVVNGVPMTVWNRVSPADETNSPQAVADRLKAFHDRSTHASITLPWLTPVTELIPDALNALGEHHVLSPRTIVRLWQEYERVMGSLQETHAPDIAVIHGDALLPSAVNDLPDLRPFLDARELQATVWLACMAVQRPDRYRRPADEYLSRLLDRIAC